MLNLIEFHKNSTNSERINYCEKVPLSLSRFFDDSNCCLLKGKNNYESLCPVKKEVWVFFFFEYFTNENKECFQTPSLRRQPNTREPATFLHCARLGLLAWRKPLQDHLPEAELFKWSEPRYFPIQKVLFSKEAIPCKLENAK